MSQTFYPHKRIYVVLDEIDDGVPRVMVERSDGTQTNTPSSVGVCLGVTVPLYPSRQETKFRDHISFVQNPHLTI